jgi:hypothetical protein
MNGARLLTYNPAEVKQLYHEKKYTPHSHLLFFIGFDPEYKFSEQHE